VLNRPQVISMIMPGGLGDLAAFTTEEVKEATKSFTRLPNNPFMLSPHTTKRLVQLTLWAKDQERLGIAVNFENGTTQPQFTVAIEEAQQREKIRKERQKSAENLPSVKVEPPLKTSAGWDAWSTSIETALTLAYGSKGVPLAYLIRENAAPDLTVGGTWEEMAISGAPLAGLDYDADKLNVHLFILNNVGEESDAYTYIQPILGRKDGRRDILALRGRYDNEATVQTRVNMANKTWELLVYKNERAMSFEEFCSKLQKALQNFERAGRAKHEGDIIDWIWAHIQNAELGQILAALKAGQAMAARTPTQILQEIAKEIPNLHKGSNFQSRVSAMEIHGSNDYTFDGYPPSRGAYTTDGRLFCGSYPHRQWFNDEMSEFRQQIMEIRDQHPELRPARGVGGGKDKSNSPNRRNQDKKHNYKLKSLQQQHEKMKAKLSALQSNLEDKDDVDDDDDDDTDHAGNAFGGRASMKGKKKPA
jgi:hypothetical protein